MQSQSFRCNAGCLLTLIGLTFATPAPAQFTYETNNGAITITSYTGADADVTVPATIDGYPVTSLGDGAFAVNFTLATVTLPSGLTNIGVEAFAVTTLAHIVIPDTVTTIGARAFSSSHITNLVIPESVSQISERLFSSCNWLSELTLPAGLTHIGAYAFEACYSLTNLTLPNTVTHIADQAFSYNGLTSLFLPASVTNVGNTIFFSSRFLEAITVDEANPAFSSRDGVLFNKDQTTLISYPYAKTNNYRIPDGVTIIAADAFNYGGEFTVPSPQRFIVPGSVTNIGAYAFSRCRSLTALFFLGNAVTNLGGEVFYFTDDVTIYYMPGTTGWQPMLDSRPTALWNPAVPPGSIGMPTNPFGFTITGTANIPVAIEASTNLIGSWEVLQSLRLTNGTVYFSDPQSGNYPQRYYRLGAP